MKSLDSALPVLRFLLALVGLWIGGCDPDEARTSRRTPEPAEAQPPQGSGDTGASTVPSATAPGSVGAGVPSPVVDAEPPPPVPGLLRGGVAGDRGMAVASDHVELVAFEKSTRLATQGQPSPVLLYWGGYGTRNLNFISQPVGVAEHMKANPTMWRTWRRTPNGIETKAPDSAEWKPLPYQYEARPQAKGTKLSGLYEHIYGAALPGAATQKIRRFRFSPDGTFESCETEKDTWTTVGATARDTAKLMGTYEVDGHVIRLAYSNTAKQDLPFFFVPPSQLWMEDFYFTTPKTAATTLCVAPL